MTVIGPQFRFSTQAHHVLREKRGGLLWHCAGSPQLPTSGTHSPAAAADGVYSPLEAPSAGQTVHALEHGRVDIQYRPGLARRDIAQLEALVAENDGYHQLLFQNQTKMPFVIAATSWTQMLGCKTFSPKVFDALRNFRERYADQAPEQVP